MVDTPFSVMDKVSNVYDSWHYKQSFKMWTWMWRTSGSKCKCFEGLKKKLSLKYKVKLGYMLRLSIGFLNSAVGYKNNDASNFVSFSCMVLTRVPLSFFNCLKHVILPHYLKILWYDKLISVMEITKSEGSLVGE